jgi:hypothetical protein
VQCGGARFTVRSARISRSTHPVLSVQIDGETGRFLYLGSSWNEAFPPPDGADAVLIGLHGPIAKQSFSPNVPGASLVVVREGLPLTDGGDPTSIRITNETIRVVLPAP